MATREEIRRVMTVNAELYLSPVHARQLVSDIILDLHLQGVVRKVERELPKPLIASWVDWGVDDISKVAEWDTQKALDMAGYSATEPLIEKKEIPLSELPKFIHRKPAVRK